jgi:hypothetical protein
MVLHNRRAGSTAREGGALARRGEHGLRLGFLLLALAVIAPATGGAADRAAAPPPASSVRDSPGWYPPADAESLAVSTGRRAAPRIDLPFSGGAASLEGLGRAVVAALNAADRDSLWKLCVTEREFTLILWPEFPDSRPVTRATAEDAWFFLSRRLNAGVGALLDEFGGDSLEFVVVERRGAPEEYRNFRLHDGVSIRVRRPGRDAESIEIVRTVAERRSRFKIYSTKD